MRCSERFVFEKRTTRCRLSPRHSCTAKIKKGETTGRVLTAAMGHQVIDRRVLDDVRTACAAMAVAAEQLQLDLGKITKREPDRTPPSMRLARLHEQCPAAELGSFDGGALHNADMFELLFHSDLIDLAMELTGSDAVSLRRGYRVQTPVVTEDQACTGTSLGKQLMTALRNVDRIY